MKKRSSESPGPELSGILIADQIEALPRSPEPTAIPDEVRGVAFGPFRLEPDGTLLRGKAVVHLPPKELAALRLLIAHAGQIVTPEQLRRALWGSVHVSADSVPRCLSSLRSNLEPETCIQTVYKRGYRFSATLRWETGASPLPLARLAILPFIPGPNVPEHLGAAIAEETITRLTDAQPAVISMLARDSTFTLAGRGLTAHHIGQMLKADLVLTGTLRALPSQFRLRAEMIRVEDGSQIWVEDLLICRDRSADLENDLAERLFFRLHSGAAIDAYTAPSLSPLRNSESLNIAAAGTEELVGKAEKREAYELFQFAHYEWQTLQRHQMQDAMQRLLRATELDPSLIAAKIDLAQLCVAQSAYGFVSPTLAADCVRQTAESIPDLVDQAKEILPSLGFINLVVDHNLAGAISAFSRSAQLPHDPWITFARAMFSLSRHRFGEAIGILEAALAEDPYAPWLHARLAWAFHLADRPEESVQQIRTGMERFPGHESAAVYGSMILPFNGDVERGLQLAESLSAREPYFDFVIALHAYALASAGRKDEARERLDRLQWLSRERFVSPSFNSATLVALGDLEAAVAELRTAGQARCPWFFQMLADPRLKPLHGHSEFQEMRSILTRMEAATTG